MNLTRGPPWNHHGTTHANNARLSSPPCDATKSRNAHKEHSGAHEEHSEAPEEHEHTRSPREAHGKPIISPQEAAQRSGIETIMVIIKQLQRLDWGSTSILQGDGWSTSMLQGYE